jgi:hypothetical protein
MASCITNVLDVLVLSAVPVKKGHLEYQKLGSIGAPYSVSAIVNFPSSNVPHLFDPLTVLTTTHDTVEEFCIELINDRGNLSCANSLELR